MSASADINASAMVFTMDGRHPRRRHPLTCRQAGRTHLRACWNTKTSAFREIMYRRLDKGGGVTTRLLKAPLNKEGRTTYSGCS
ncbi:hypothetical protein GCM10011574_59460 [Microbispora bryophytorum]|uniref:Uncharacterized protein n=1 Tax=Microbispora bryophytorum TaxID=1460882 RepID=A0A8H9H4K1_9ACTN|nr:hypothetical protein GCM10011574_59460 [Microbispora bryophytorum]